jgi:hypothetical protein
MSRHMVSTWLLVLLAFGAGGAAGILMERNARITGHVAWMAQQWRSRQAERQHRQAYARQVLDPVQRHRDSLLNARISTYRWRPPLEIRRVQAGAHCAVSYEMQDTLFRHLSLFSAKAFDSDGPPVLSEGGQPMLPLAEGAAYREGGWDRGDTVTVVLPNVWCGGLGIIGSGGTAVAPPPPITVEQR